jgi:hypothetical protein
MNTLKDTNGGAAADVVDVASPSPADYATWRAGYDAGWEFWEKNGSTQADGTLPRFASLAAMLALAMSR